MTTKTSNQLKVAGFQPVKNFWPKIKWLARQQGVCEVAVSQPQNHTRLTGNKPPRKLPRRIWTTHHRTPVDSSETSFTYRLNNWFGYQEVTIIFSSQKEREIFTEDLLGLD